MESKEMTVDTLNDLVLINNDRITGYERALQELDEQDADLKPIFTNYIQQSQQCKMELGTEIQSYGEDMETGSTSSGTLYRAWMDIKAVFTGHDRETVLANCEAGEDAAQIAYKTALEDEELPAYLREIITRQQEVLRTAHNEVKSLRDIA